jgi:hypothetical protein
METGEHPVCPQVSPGFLNIVSINGTTYATGACGGYQWLTYALTDQSGNRINYGNVNFSESFSNLSPPVDPIAPTAGPPVTINLATGVLSDTYAVWTATSCPYDNVSDSFNQQWTPNIGGTISGGVISGGVTYPLTTVISASQSSNSQGLPSFDVSITTP